MKNLPYFKVHGAVNIAFMVLMFLALGMAGAVIAALISVAWQLRYSRYLDGLQQDIIDKCDRAQAARNGETS